MTNGWVGKKKNWLRKKRRNAAADPEPEPEYGTVYHVVKCPRCGSRRVKCYRTVETTRYYRCLETDCEFRFKAVPAD